MLVTLLSFIFVLGVLVLIHELGHFIIAKMVGIRVERFSMGFPPRMFGKKIGDTDYCISWIPIGGYVKMSGMIDETNYDENSIQGEPWEFMSKPLYQRFLVIFAGPLMNLLLAVLIFSGITFISGINEPLGPVIGNVEQNTYAEHIGFQKGDLITQIDNNKVDTWNEVSDFLQKKQQVLVHWKRDDDIFSKMMIPSFVDSIEQTVPAIVGDVIKNFPADSAGMLKGDQIVSVNDHQIKTWNDLTNIIYKLPKERILIEWLRNDEKHSSTIIPIRDKTDGKGKIGISLLMKKKQVGPFYSIYAGFTYSVNLTRLVYKSIKMIFSGQESFKDAFGGPIVIAKMAGDSARSGPETLFVFMAFLSLNLGFLNLLPIPVLDGGHLLILLIEGIIRRPIPTKAKMVIQQIGMALLLALMVFVIINDIRRVW